MSRQFYIPQDGELIPKSAPLQPLQPGYVRIKTKAIAGNPIDLRHLKTQLADGCAAGCDVSGVVTEVADDVTAVKVGDEVATVVPGGDIGNRDLGAFSTIVEAPQDSLFKFSGLKPLSEAKVPAGKVESFEQAAGIPLCLLTAAYIFEINNGTPIIPDSAKGYILINGAATGVGFVAVQIAKYIGFEVIATASEKHHKLLEQLGADHLIDYNDEDWVEQVRDIAGDRITFGFDAVSTPDTRIAMYQAVSTTLPTRLHHVRMPPLSKVPYPRENVTSCPTCVYWYFLTKKKVGLDILFAVPGIMDERAGTIQRLQDFIKLYPLTAPAIEVVGHGYEEVPKLYEALEAGASGNRFAVSF